MFRSRLTVTVPRPCHEDWSVMTPQAQGRFCQSCQKTVVDFTQMSDTQVAQWLSKQQGSTCGRFRTDQLGKELLTASSIRQRWTWRAAVLAFIAWLSTRSTEAQTTSSIVTSEQSALPTSNISTLSASKASPKLDNLVIRGVVLDSTDNSPIVGVAVVLQGTSQGVQTDSLGKFSIQLPEQSASKSILVFSYIGLRSTEKTLDELAKAEYKVLLKPDFTNVTTGIVETVTLRPWSPRSIYYKIRSLFY